MGTHFSHYGRVAFCMAGVKPFPWQTPGTGYMTAVILPVGGMGVEVLSPSVCIS